MDGVVGRGTVLAGRYQVDEPRPSELPGTSQWAATDQILARPVLVRVFPAAGAGPALDAARRAALVSDPRLVRVLDVGSDQAVGYVVTELVTGPTLAQLVGREPLSADQARAIVGEAAAALEVARRRGVHHLALRPSSLAVSDDGRVLVSGLALDATLLGRHGGDARMTSRDDAADLVRLVYAALTAHWPGPRETSDGLPTAPEHDGVPVPPADLVPAVPSDLNTLCVVTLGRDDDGPLSPADLVRELEPWGDIRVRARPNAPVTPAVAPPPGVPGQVVRQSVRSAFSTSGSPRHGTPPLAPRDAATPPLGAPLAVPPPAPPMPPPGAVPSGWTASGGVLPADLASAALPPAVPPPGPVGDGPAALASPPGPVPDDDPFDFGQFDNPPPRRTGMGVAIAFVALLLVVAIAFAAKALFTGNGSPEPGAAGGASPRPSVTTSGPASSAPASPTPTPTARAGATPVISAITTINPADPSGEHQELVGRAFDGDPSTYWMSMTYATANFGRIKPAVGLQVTLAGPATVSTVTLHVNGTGGAVEVRTGDATAPGAGTLLASGSMSQDTVLTLSSPQTTSSLVIWFTELPTAADGSFRIELTEIRLG